jgi:hypothetical protein
MSEVYSIMQLVTQDTIALNDWLKMNKELERIQKELRIAEF